MILASFIFGGFWRSQFVILSRSYDLKYEVVECLQTIILLSSLPVALEEEASKISKFAIVEIFSTMYYELVIVTLMMLSLYLWSVSVDRKHTIRKVKFLSKNSILTKPQHFHKFLVKSKLSTAEKVKNHNIFTSFSPPKNRLFSRKIKVGFLDKKWRFRTVWENRLSDFDYFAPKSW